MSTPDNVSLEFLGQEIRRMQEQLAAINRDHNRLLEGNLQLMRIVQNLDRRLSDVKEELEVTIKSNSAAPWPSRKPASTIAS